MAEAFMLLGGGFLAAVLWMDLMFDVQTLRHPARDGDIPEPVLASIAAYYRRVTTDAFPMGHLVGTMMLVTIAASLVHLARNPEPLAARLAPLLIVVAPVALAAGRVVPSAGRLGARTDGPAVQSALARAICRDHLLCLGAILAFIAAVLVG
jgi:hypothetical protein